METRKKILVLAITSAALLLFALLSFPNNSTFIHLVYATGDSYGNDINYIEIWQYNGTDYILKANFTSSGGSTRINDNQTTKFVVGIRFNDTLASTNEEAMEYTKVMMNITGVWTSMELNNTSCQLIDGFYYLREEGIWSHLIAGETYECSVLYQGYY